MAGVVVHITSAADWRAAQIEGTYRLSTRDRSLDQVGFIHCSYPDQVLRVANAVYAGVHGLLLLVIDAARVTPPIHLEALEGSTERFPHVYGPLNLDAVVRVLTFEPAADGTFGLPPGLASAANDSDVR